MHRFRIFSSGGKRSSIIGRGAMGGMALMAAMSAAQADGAISLTLSEPGFSPLTLNDTSNAGSVTYFGNYGDFSTNFVVGFSNKLSGMPAGEAELQIQSLDVISNSATSAAHTLTISLMDTGFTFPGTVGQRLVVGSNLGGTLTPPVAGDSISFQSTATPSTGSAVTGGVQQYNFTGPAASSVSFVVPTATPTAFLQTGSFGLADTIVASLSGQGSSVSLSGTTAVTVPEPVAISMMAMSGLGLLSRRRPHSLNQHKIKMASVPASTALVDAGILLGDMVIRAL